MHCTSVKRFNLDSTRRNAQLNSEYFGKNWIEQHRTEWNRTEHINSYAALHIQTDETTTTRTMLMIMTMTMTTNTTVRLWRGATNVMLWPRVSTLLLESAQPLKIMKVNTHTRIAFDWKSVNSNLPFFPDWSCWYTSISKTFNIYIFNVYIFYWLWFYFILFYSPMRWTDRELRIRKKYANTRKNKHKLFYGNICQWFGSERGNGLLLAIRWLPAQKNTHKIN